MTDLEFISGWRSAHDSKDFGAWILCEFALLCREQGYPGWDDKIAFHERRASRTVRDWARAAKFRLDIGRVGDLTYPFYLSAMRAIDVAPLADVLKLMHEYAADPEGKFESFAAAVNKLAGHTVDHAAQWAVQAERLYTLSDSMEVTPEVGEELRTAAGALRRAAGGGQKSKPLSLPLWDAATAREYLARVNGSGADVHFVLLEGPEWDVERVVVRPEKEKPK